MARDIVKVIEACLAVVPPEQTELKRRLEYVLNDAGYRPPEGMSLSWGKLAAVLTDQIGEPSEDWQRRISDIVSGREPVEGA